MWRLLPARWHHPSSAEEARSLSSSPAGFRTSRSTLSAPAATESGPVVMSAIAPSAEERREETPASREIVFEGAYGLFPAWQEFWVKNEAGTANTLVGTLASRDSVGRPQGGEIWARRVSTS